MPAGKLFIPLPSSLSCWSDAVCGAYDCALEGCRVLAIRSDRFPNGATFHFPLIFCKINRKVSEYPGYTAAVRTTYMRVCIFGIDILAMLLFPPQVIEIEAPVSSNNRTESDHIGFPIHLIGHSSSEHHLVQNRYSLSTSGENPKFNFPSRSRIPLFFKKRQ